MQSPSTTVQVGSCGSIVVHSTAQSIGWAISVQIFLQLQWLNIALHVDEPEDELLDDELLEPVSPEDELLDDEAGQQQLIVAA